MSKSEPIYLLDDPRVWTGPVYGGTKEPERTKAPLQEKSESPYADGLYRPDPFGNLPRQIEFLPTEQLKPVGPRVDEHFTKAIPNSPKINLTPEQEKKVKEMMTAGQAARGNAGKPRWSLLALEVFEPVVRVLMFGAKKYAAWNFTNDKGLSWTETGECMQRHLNAWLRGEDNDPESGESHLGHIGCNLMFLLYYRMYAHKGYGERDDRNKR